MYLLATHAVDATRFAAQVLGIPVLEQQARIRLVSDVSHLPQHFEKGDVVRATLFFEHALAQKQVGPRLIASAVSNMNREIQPPYDVPRQLTRESIEEWLDS